MPIANTEIPGFYCSDLEVQRFCQREAWNIGPYSVPEFTKSARELFQAARARFGDYRCWDLEFWEH
jgi:hypothetical protein